MSNPKGSKSILFLKDEDVSYRTAFAQHGYESHFIPVLSFRFANERIVSEVLASRLEAISGFIYTSPRASSHFMEVLNSASADVRDQVYTNNANGQLPLYSVGRSTGKPLLSAGLHVKGEDCGSAAELAKYLENHHHCMGKPLLFLCGDKRRDVITESMVARGEPIEEIVVYESVPVDKIEVPDEWEQPLWVVFFSPSGVRLATDELSNRWANARTAAIGKTTAAALQDAAKQGCVVCASKPMAEVLASEILMYDQQIGT